MTKRAITSAAMLLVSCACARGIATEGGEPAQPVRIEVTNETGGPMKVYAIGTGTFYWIGTAYPGLRERFAVPVGMAIDGSIEFMARSGSGRMVRTGPLLLLPGDVVMFSLTPHVATSTARVRRSG